MMEGGDDGKVEGADPLDVFMATVAAVATPQVHTAVPRRPRRTPRGTPISRASTRRRMTAVQIMLAASQAPRNHAPARDQCARLGLPTDYFSPAAVRERYLDAITLGCGAGDGGAGSADSGMAPPTFSHRLSDAAAAAGRVAACCDDEEVAGAEHAWAFLPAAGADAPPPWLTLAVARFMSRSGADAAAVDYARTVDGNADLDALCRDAVLDEEEAYFADEGST